MNGAFISFTSAEVSAYYRVRVPHLKQTRAREWRGSCPICQHESDRCFVVTPSKQLWHCFSCRAGGDCIELIANIEDCSPKKAAELIAAHFLTAAHALK